LFLREVDVVRVAGKDDVTRIYELLGSGDSLQLGNNVMDSIQNYCHGVAAYRQKNIESALGYFSKAADEGDGPSCLFEERCEFLLQNPPGSDWDGVWDMRKVSVWTYKNESKKKARTPRRSSNLSALPKFENTQEVAKASRGARKARSGSIILNPGQSLLGGIQGSSSNLQIATSSEEKQEKT